MRQSQRHFHRKPTRRSAGISPIAWITMPSVVPTPITRIWLLVIVSGVGGCRTDGSMMKTTAVTVTTMLFRIGVKAGAAKCPRVFSTAASRPARP